MLAVVTLFMLSGCITFKQGVTSGGVRIMMMDDQKYILTPLPVIRLNGFSEGLKPSDIFNDISAASTSRDGGNRYWFVYDSDKRNLRMLQDVSGSSVAIYFSVDDQRSSEKSLLLSPFVAFAEGLRGKTIPMSINNAVGRLDTARKDMQDLTKLVDAATRR